MRQVLQVRKVISVVLCLVTCGCAAITRQPNRCIVTWDAVRAQRHLNQIPPAQGYTDVRINLDKLGQGLTLRMPDGKLLRTSEITPEVVWPYTFFSHIGNKFPHTSVHGRVQFGVLFDCSFWASGGGYNFEFQDGRLVAVGAGGNNPSRPESCRPGIGNADGTIMYWMPLTEKQLTNLFGPFLRKEEVWGGI